VGAEEERMIRPFKPTGRDTYEAKLPLERGGWRKVSLSTKHLGTARRICEMLDALGPEEERAWDILATIRQGGESAASLYDRWTVCGKSVSALRRALERVDLEQMVDTFLAAAHCSDDTKAHYRAHLRRLFPKGTPFDASGFTVARVQRFVDDLKMSPASKRKAGASLRTFANWLVRRGLLASNPVREIRLPSNPPARKHFLDTPDAQLLADAQPSPYRELSALLAGSGIEVSVALRLRRRDVDMRTKEVRAAGTKTHTRDRVVRVADWAWPYVLRAMRDKKADARLFESIPDRWLAGDQHRAAASTLAKQSPVFDGYTMRDHRHTYAVRQIRAGVPVEVVARQLGHANSTLVQTVYGRFAPSHHERDRWERLATQAEKARRTEQTPVNTDTE
jgi:integrase